MLVLISLAVAGGFAIAIGLRGPSVEVTARMSWIATAHQLGPVGYRDPVGAISPDGRWMAYSEGRFLRVRPIDGGPSVALPPGDAQIRHLTWHPDSQSILTDGDSSSTWVVYNLSTRARRPLWPELGTLTATIESAVNGKPDRGKSMTIAVRDLRQPIWSTDGQSIAATVNTNEGPQLWTISANGGTSRAQRVSSPINSPAWTPTGEVACIALDNGHPRVTIPCGGQVVRSDPALDFYGPLAFSPDGTRLFASAANANGTVDLWSVPFSSRSVMFSGKSHRLTSFSRDTYAPTVAHDGTMLFKVQSYRTMVAMISMEPTHDRDVQPLTTFQSETPSWDWSGRWIGLTFGSWRRVVDDARYPDIAQDTGIIGVDPAHPASKPSSIVHASESEDQSLCWSPNGRWIAFHSHRDQSDDIWLRPANDESAVRRVTFLGRGAETGWPRWSPDGRWLLFDGAPPSSRKPSMFVMGIDQDTGVIAIEPHEVIVQGVPAVISHGEWLPDSGHIVGLAKEGPGQHIIFTVERSGGTGRIVHRFSSEHDTSGLAASPDGREIAFVAPAADGFFQVYRMPIAGGTPIQVTMDPSNKTQPAWSPDGRSLAFTVWSYDAQFWSARF
jgi:Tol biopolymer transport system component